MNDSSGHGSSAVGGGLDPAAVVRLRLVVARLHRQLAQASDRQDFTFAQLSALARIEAHGPIRLGELAARERVAAPSMTRTVTPLVASGLVTRLPDPEDGRSALVELSAEGVELLAEIRQRRSEVLARRTAELDVRERAVLLEALPVLERLVAFED
ncbi:MarR family winged helix-turn-helix transcriptional regulator [Kitasatospora sp. CB02891]|uniref:MarR family winged helix-turn-helix transcriptional regulator n=1 Tax=Kitasatospora sp. CB02891 TaxID=2020329 RepID=UPI000C277E8D|nr:MarR family transcriptional regulator [Kitasatospora sp. CB02891]PJN23002.1 MarR family transcriptional regulator [Kitasatospora sp. CB02891]